MRALAEAGGDRLLSFALPEDHLHAVLRAWSAGLLARDVRRLLKRVRPDLEPKDPDVRVVDGPGHLRNLVAYHVSQPTHHREDAHPATFTGSCFPDLVGARRLPGFDPRRRLKAELPGLRLRELYPIVGLDPEELAPASDQALRWAGAGRLVDLAACVFALPLGLRGEPGAALTRARALVAGAARRLELRLVDLAAALGVTRQAVSKLSLRSVDAADLRALRLRLALEERGRDGGMRVVLGPGWSA